MLKTSETYNLNSGLQQKLAGSLAAFNVLLLVSTAYAKMPRGSGLKELDLRYAQ